MDHLWSMVLQLTDNNYKPHGVRERRSAADDWTKRKTNEPSTETMNETAMPKPNLDSITTEAEDQEAEIYKW